MKTWDGDPQKWYDVLGDRSGSSVSDCHLYRYLLWRVWDKEFRPMSFCMLNPSTADACVDDPTIRRCMGFARREGCGGILVVNLIPFRATKPADLEIAWKSGRDVFHESCNNQALRMASDLGLRVLAWGASIRPWMDRSARLARREFSNAMCLGKTKRGEPRHPLMVPNDQPLVQFVGQPPAGNTKPKEASNG